MKYTQHEDWEKYKADFAERFTLEESYVICGVGGGFRTLMELFPQIKIQYCLDARASELSLDDKELFPYKILKQRDIHFQRFIITAGDEYYCEIKRSLLMYGALEENIASLPEILFFWGKRYRGEMLSTACNVILLTNCNLRCKACIQLVPHVKRFQYTNLESVIENMEQYFRIFTYVQDLILVGGETLLYKELEQVLSYIKSHFQGRYHVLKLFTNGQIAPKESAIAELGKLGRVQVWISDYSRNIEKDSNKLIEYLIKYDIPYTLNSSFGQSAEYRWFDLGDPTQLKDGDAKERFRKCSMLCLSLFDHKMYYCAPSCSNVVGKITELEHTEACLDLNEIEQMTPAQRAEQIGRFNLGFMDKAHLEFCRFCNGYGEDVNTRYVRAGEQC